ncbi:MAG: SIS domain-containing protein [Chloroflexota bacterium]
MNLQNAPDRDRPLPGPPDPWTASSMPPLRPGPPFVMTEMIDAEPAVAERIASRLLPPDSPAAVLATQIRRALERGEPVVFTGCGTSEHAAIGAADIVRGAARDTGLIVSLVTSEQALELALDPPDRGVVIAISHEGASAATNRAVEASRDAGASTAIVTVTERSPGGRLADVVVTTDELDQGWCHTIGYLAPLVAATVVAAHLANQALDPRAVRARVEAGLASAGDAERLAAALLETGPILAIGSGTDRPAARELVLKIEEGAWIPSAMRDLETFLHGHLAATDAKTGLVVLLTDPAGRAARVERTRQALAAARAIGIVAGAILAADADVAIDPELTPAGRIVIPEDRVLPGEAGSLLGTVVPLQLLTERLARAAGVNPDPIRRDDPRYLAAARAAE